MLQIAGYYKYVVANGISLMFPAFVVASCGAIAGIAIMLALKAVSKAALYRE